MPKMKGLGASLLNGVRFFDAYAHLKRSRVGSQAVIAMYHRVSSDIDDWSISSQVIRRSFESQMQYLRQNYEIISLDELLGALQHRKSLPKKAIAITFDDGYRDNYLNAFPILRKYRIPATFFLTTGYIGVGKPFWWDTVGYLIYNATVRRLELDELGTFSMTSTSDRRRTALTIEDKLERLPEERKNEQIKKLADICRAEIPADLGRQLVLSWDEVEEMQREGAQFGAHSVTHSVLTNLPLAQARWEIRQSKEDLEKRLREEVRFFSYPAGQYSSEIVKIVEENGYAGAATSDWLWITAESDPYRLGRIPMMEDRSKNAALLSGFVGDLEALHIKMEYR